MARTTESGRAAMVARVRALLAKAERTDNPHEAEVFFGKAAELMDKYRIAMAEVRAAMGDEGAIGGVVVSLEHTRNRRASAWLLGAVARHYAVVVGGKETGATRRLVLIGEEPDIEAVQMMFGSLIIQRDRACLNTPVPDGVNTISFRNSFAYGYGSRINDRLEELRRTQEAAAVADGDTMALEVFGRYEKLLDVLGNPDPVQQDKINLDPLGFIHGDGAARTADLGQDRIEATGSRAITAG